MVNQTGRVALIPITSQNPLQPLHRGFFLPYDYGYYLGGLPVSDDLNSISQRLRTVELSHAEFEARHEGALAKIGDIARTQETMADSISRLVALHENSRRFFDIVDDLRVDFASLAESIKPLQEARKWQLISYGLILTAFVGQLIIMVLHK